MGKNKREKELDEKMEINENGKNKDCFEKHKSTKFTFLPCGASRSSTPSAVAHCWAFQRQDLAASK